MKGPGGDEDHCTPFRSVELCLGTMVSVEEHVLDVSFFFCAVKSGSLVSWVCGPSLDGAVGRFLSSRDFVAQWSFFGVIRLSFSNRCLLWLP